MSDIKLSVTFTLQGRVLCEEANCQSVERLCVGGTELIVKTRGFKPAKQVIKMNKEAYWYMLETPVAGFSPSKWKSMSRKMRIAEHLKITAVDLKAKDFSWIEFED